MACSHRSNIQENAQPDSCNSSSAPAQGVRPQQASPCNAWGAYVVERVTLRRPRPDHGVQHTALALLRARARPTQLPSPSVSALHVTMKAPLRSAQPHAKLLHLPNCYICHCCSSSSCLCCSSSRRRRSSWPPRRGRTDLRPTPRRRRRKPRRPRQCPLQSLPMIRGTATTPANPTAKPQKTLRRRVQTPPPHP